MNRIATVTRGAVFALLLLTLAAPGAQVIVDYSRLPAATEAALFKESFAVIRARVIARKIDAPDNGPESSVYRVEILELLKSYDELVRLRVVDIHRHGGFDGKAIVVGFPPFEAGEEVVLFLERGQNGWYWPLLGPDGAFRLTTDGRVHAYGQVGTISRKYDGRASEEFLSVLRKYRE